MKKLITNIVTLILIQITLLLIGSLTLMFVVNFIYLIVGVFAIASLSKLVNVLTEKHKNEIKPDKFHKILLKCVDDKQLLLDSNWEWFIEKLDTHKYQVDGYHPIAKRMTYIKDNVIV